MVSNLYDILDVPKDATPEQIRKAYKKRALQTHPDRLPPGATSSDKAKSEEQFRKVNNAYEVLTDPQNRRIYDHHGVWPPPQPEQEEPFRRASSSRARYPRGDRRAPRTGQWPEPDFDFPSFVFTDPFMLFDSIFGDRHRSAFDRHDFTESPFERMQRLHMEMSNSMMDMHRSMFTGMPSSSVAFPNRSPFGTSHQGFSHSLSFGNDGQRWAKESYTTTIVNGVKQSVHKRKDWDGTEHVTRTYPDGRKVHTINGIEQPSNTHGFLPYSGPGDSRHQPPPAAQQRSNSSDYMLPPPPPYPGHGAGAGAGYNSASQAPEYDQRRGRRHSESPAGHNSHNMFTPDSAPVIPDYNHQRQPRKRWWQSGR